MEIKMDEKFYSIPGSPRYEINIDGDLRDKTTGKIKTWYVQKPQKFLGGRMRNMRRGYKIARLISEDGKKYHIFQHRALAMIFIKCPGNFSDYVVNHKNGIGSDNSINNLEWVTYSENMRHAYASGLCGNMRAVEIKLTLTGEIIEFKSASECGIYLNQDSGHMASLITRANGRIHRGLKCALRWKDKEIPWSNDCMKHAILEQYYAYHVGDKNLYISTSIIELSKNTGCSDSVISAYLRRKNLNKVPINGFIFGAYKDLNSVPEYDNIQCAYFTMKKIKSDYPGWVVLDNIEHTEIIMLIEDIMELLQLTRNETRKKLKNGVSDCGRYSFRLIGTRPICYSPFIK